MCIRRGGVSVSFGLRFSRSGNRRRRLTRGQARSDLYHQLRFPRRLLLGPFLLTRRRGCIGGELARTYALFRDHLALGFHDRSTKITGQRRAKSRYIAIARRKFAECISRSLCVRLRQLAFLHHLPI